MREHVTVVPADTLIIVDGQSLHFAFGAEEHMHALQWHNGAGHIEWTDAANQPLGQAQYADVVAPFVALWEAELARLEQAAADAAAAAEAAYNSPEAVRARRIAAIHAELALLDTALPRSVEDLLESGAIVAESLSAENQARRAQKTALRAELAQLEAVA